MNTDHASALHQNPVLYPCNTDQPLRETAGVLNTLLHSLGSPSWIVLAFAFLQLFWNAYTPSTRSLLQDFLLLLLFHRALLRTQKLCGAITSVMITNKGKCLLSPCCIKPTSWAGSNLLTAWKDGPCDITRTVDHWLYGQSTLHHLPGVLRLHHFSYPVGKSHRSLDPSNT